MNSVRSTRPQLLQRQVELVLALLCGQAPQHGRGQHAAGLQGGDQAQDFAPIDRRLKRFSRRLLRGELEECAGRAGEPLVSGCGQLQPFHDGGNGIRRQQVAVEAAIACRVFDPDIVGAQLIAQRRQNGRLV